jgi:hypothetical protein
MIEVLKDVMERGFEFSAIHKLLHMTSKLIFLLFLIQLVAVFSRFLSISLLLSSALPSNTYSLSFLALVLFLLSIGLDYYKKVAFSRILFENFSSINIIDLVQYLPCEEDVDLFTAKDVVAETAIQVFYDKVIEVLYREKPWKILIKIKLVMILFVMIFIENLILILVSYIALKVLHISIEELVWLPLANLNPLLKTVLKAMMLFALAFALEHLNISTTIPSASRRSAKEKILTASLYIALYVTLLEIGQPIRIALSRKAKAFFTLILLLVSSPWDPLISTRKSEGITSPKPMKAAFIFTPSPNTLIERNKNDVISNVFEEVCGKAFEKLGIARTGRPCVAMLREDGEHTMSNKNKKVKRVRYTTMLKQEIVEATRVALESLGASFTQLLNDWIVEFADFSKLRNVIKKDKDYAEVIKRLFTEYSIITPNIEEASSEDLRKLLRLYCDKEMLKNLGELAQNFTLIIPIIAITRSPHRSDLGIKLRAPISILIPQPIYIAIPVLIALNLWAEPEKMSRFRELLEKGIGLA